MKGEREVKNGVSEEEREVKRKRLMERSDSPPPPLGFNNPLLPLANAYDDDDEEDDNEQKKSQTRGNGIAKGEGNGNKVRGEVVDDEDDDDDDDEASKGRGKHSRHVEVRRDCPYLDTVNRQVIIINQFLVLVLVMYLIYGRSFSFAEFIVKYLVLYFRCWILILRGFALSPCQI